MKTFRIFYKKKEDPTTAKSCEIEEVTVDSFNDAVQAAYMKAEEKNYRVVMVAELPK